jgi:2-keto-4-pentenoate hydratase/2-oxohepta-3-ene-1,7-dioic acid hydratase in catechol pathway
MKIVRFIDARGRTCWGSQTIDGEAEVLSGDPVRGLEPTGERCAIGKLLCPVDPPALLCIGLNYRDHAAETGQVLTARPVVFMKNPAALQHPGDPILLPRSMVERPEADYEVELAVVIGRAAKGISRADALSHVLGYSVANDVSARRLQKEGRQWVRGKSVDTFCPLGPALATPDEVPDPQALSLETRLNGEVMQRSSTAEMIFSVAELIADLSREMTLLPGTIILTGTPAGVGFTRTPPVFLKPGDELELTIDGIGTLRNPVRAA